MLHKKSTILMLSLVLATGLLKANIGENTTITKTKVNIEASNSQNALIIKSTNDCNVRIIDETGHAVLEQKMDRGTNKLNLQNIKSAKYKIEVTNGEFSLIRKLSVR
jgi:cytoskeletal protein RodZ